jgi:hypothetical protein
MTSNHQKKIIALQQEIRKQAAPLALTYGKGYSNTTRSKSYKKGCLPLPCNSLNQIIQIDTQKKRLWTEPRVTMEALVKATLAHGLIPSIVPEFKGITVGGAIMGAAAESSSHRCGIFHDSCTELHFINGKGELQKASPEINSDLFYGLSGSYGSLGLLTSAELQLIPAKKCVKLSYQRFEDPSQALEKLQAMIGGLDFVDGVMFSRDHILIISGELSDEVAPAPSQGLWFAKLLQQGQAPSLMPLFDYLFRYDQGAFWMGTFLFSFPFLARYLGQGLMKIWPDRGRFTTKEIAKFKALPFPSTSAMHLTRPLVGSQPLWGLLHKAEKWVQDRLIIQDFCIPFSNAASFLKEVIKEPGTFPIWLCPIKGTHSPQFLAPHYGHAYFLNFGIYGSPSYSAPMSKIMKKLEELTQTLMGRKVLYSRSYYDTNTFWQIYPKSHYDHLRQKTHAQGVWRNLTEKVLSE